MALPKRDGSRLLLVEGADDKGVCVAFLREDGVEDVTVAVKGGYETLRESIAAEIRVSRRTHLGIVVDANGDLAARWQSVRDAVAPLGYVLPDLPQVGGTVVAADGQPRLGLWLMPDNASPGAVEDFIAALVPVSDTLLGRAREAVAAIPESERAFKPNYRTKAEIHTWLAWQEEPGRPMGLAVTKQYFDAANPVAQTFAAWLRRWLG